MKIIHCADLHLDSKISANLDNLKAKERRRELVDTYTRMVDFARENSCSAILIAGDMFDTKTVSAFTKNAVLDTIRNNPGIDFYYLKGNHDHDSLTDELTDIPDNLHLFKDEFTEYPLSASGKTVLYGAELTEEKSGLIQNSFSPDPSKINIVMLHGQTAEYTGNDRAEIVNLKAFKNKGVDYLALGHIHEYKREALDGYGVFCYPGCLEGRGFDECGEHGFVLLDIDEDAGTVKDTFIPFAKRKLFLIDVDISDLMTSTEVLNSVKTGINESGATGKDLLKIVLKGETDVDSECDTDYILNSVKDDHYHVKIKNESTVRVDYGSFMLDKSLKGEFVRLCSADDSISDAEKGEIIKLGLSVIAGGKIE